MANDESRDALALLLELTREQLLAALPESEKALAYHRRKAAEVERRITLVRQLLLLDGDPARNAAVGGVAEAVGRGSVDDTPQGAAGVGSRARAAVGTEAAGRVGAGDPRGGGAGDPGLVGAGDAAASGESGRFDESGPGRFKYHALERWLRGQPRRPVGRTFSQVEEIIGMSLPPSSRQYPAHWHGWAGSAVSRAIRRAGWKVRHLNLNEETLVFVPDLDLPVTEAGRAVRERAG